MKRLIVINHRFFCILIVKSDLSVLRAVLRFSVSQFLYSNHEVFVV